MVSIFAKAHICRVNTQVHLQFFLQIKTLVDIERPSSTQIYHSSTSSEISFHGLASKIKPPSIRKQIALPLSSQLIVLVFTKQPSAERYLANIFSPVFL